MRIYLASERFSRLCFRKFQIVKQSRKMVHLSAMIFTNKKYSIKGKSESSTRWLKRQAKVS